MLPSNGLVWPCFGLGNANLQTFYENKVMKKPKCACFILV